MTYINDLEYLPNCRQNTHVQINFTATVFIPFNKGFERNF